MVSAALAFASSFLRLMLLITLVSAEPPMEATSATATSSAIMRPPMPFFFLLELWS